MKIFWRLLFQKTNCWHLEFLINQIFGQSFIIFEKLRYMGQLLLKLRADKVGTKSWKLFGRPSTKWRPCKGFAKLGWFTINGPSKMLFFYFLIFPFTQISKDYCQKSYNGFWGFLVISTTSQIFLIYTFLKMKRRPF